MASKISRIGQLEHLTTAVLLLYVGLSLAQQDCKGVVCEPPVNCNEEVLQEGSCCPKCVQFGCTCEGYQFYDCVSVGFKDGKVPEGESYFVDFGSTECSCPPGGGRISCDFIPCPELPPNCIDIIQPVDSCIQCGRIGCVHGGEKYEAGHTFHMSECKVCHCPNTGGDLMCYTLPHCISDGDNSTQPMDMIESDPERQYDYPYSHEQEEPINSEIMERNNNYKRNALQVRSMADYGENIDELIDVEPSPTPTLPPMLVELTTVNEIHLSTQPERSTLNIQTTQITSTLTPSTPKATTAKVLPKATTPKVLPKATTPKVLPETTTAKVLPKATTAKVLPKATTPKVLPKATTAKVLPKATTAKVLPETTAQPTKKELQKPTSPTLTTIEHPTKPSTAPTMVKTTAKGETLKADPQISSQEDPSPSENKTDSPKKEKEGTVLPETEEPTTAPVLLSPSPSTGPQVLLPKLLSEGGAPKDVLNHSRSYDGSSKDLVESCCAAGQQWSIDHGECENMALDASEDCRLAQRQCCLSYIKENTCIAGMIAAKEGGICLAMENDLCERSHFKLCCDCCSLGLKIRKEGHSCESNLNLGYPCNHMMILCCTGEEQLIPPDIRIPPKPEPTSSPDKADVDECALNTHNCARTERCVNTAGSFVCVPEVMCQTGFLLEEGVCQDINECVASPAPCKPGFTCVNTLGSYVCQRKHLNCNRGYRPNGNGTMCIDFDECRTGTHNCSAEQTCTNVPGSYRCNCKAGYRYDTFRKTCIDINECWTYPGRLCHHTCENTVGSYRCSCFAGFRLSQDGRHCEDVNECDQNPCNQECTNIYGSYQCYCKEGYKLGDDGLSCEDIDECQQSIGTLCVFACVNTPGSYQCACPENGYTMTANGLSCKDIDECEIGTHNCSGSEECFNILGSYKCLSFECPENYRKVSHMKCERIQCFNYQDCQNTPVRISYHRLNFPTGVVVPAQIFRIAPSPAYAGDNILMDIKKGNEENFFSVRKFNPYTGILYLQRPIRKPKDFLLDVEMKLFRQGTVTTFLSRIYVFITPNAS
ncbi:fibulin-2 isoform X3 [Lithobates pipiens]